MFRSFVMHQTAKGRSVTPDRRPHGYLHVMFCDETVRCFSAERMFIGALLCCGSYALSLLAFG